MSTRPLADVFAGLRIDGGKLVEVVCLHTDFLANNRKKAFEVVTSAGRYPFPYVKAKPSPTTEDRVLYLTVNEELDREGFTYLLESGREGTIHIEQVFAYNSDPKYMRDELLYRLTLEAQKCVDESPLSKREISRRLGASPAKLYRLLAAALGYPRT